MMADLTQQDFSVLDAFVAAKDRIGYWTYLMDKGDAYARLALGVVTNETLNGFVANEFFLDAVEHAGIIPTPELMQDVGLDIMRADLKTRINALDEGRSLNLPVEDIQKYHHSAFLKNTGDKVGERGWTAELPLRRYVVEARRTGDWTEAERQWHQFLETDPRSLLDLDAWSLGFDSNLDSLNSAGIQRVMDWGAQIYAQDRAGETMQAPIPENDLGEYAHWAYRTAVSSLKYGLASERSVSNLSLTQIDGYNWDEARQAWIQFKRPPPNLAARPTFLPGAAGAMPKLPQPEFLAIEAPPDIAEILNHKRRNRLEWFHQKRPLLSGLSDPARLALADPLERGPKALASRGQALGALPTTPSRLALPAFEFPAQSRQEQIGIDLAFSPPPTLVDDGEEPSRVPIRIPPSAPEDAPVTQKQLSAAQDELLLNLRVMEMNRLEPKLDPVALRKMIARETEWEARCGRTIYSQPY